MHFLFYFSLQLGRNTALCQIHQFGIIHTRKIEQREEIPGPASRGIFARGSLLLKVVIFPSLAHRTSTSNLY